MWILVDPYILQSVKLLFQLCIEAFVKFQLMLVTCIDAQRGR